MWCWVFARVDPPGRGPWKMVGNRSPPGEAVERAQVVAILVPDMAQPRLFREEVQPRLRAGMTLLFAHGFNVHYGSLTPPENADVVLVAPKGPGHLVRRQFQKGMGVPCLLAVRNDASGKARARALAYAKGLGGTRAGVLTTTFEEETETDLFGDRPCYAAGLRSWCAWFRNPGGGGLPGRSGLFRMPARA